jgi:3-isopropylmalate dehydrogenase
MRVLKSLEEASGTRFEVETGGPIGEEAESRYGKGLPDPVIDFCSNIFARSGAILSGPGGGRYVYDLRKEFDLFCKFVPVLSKEALSFYVPRSNRPAEGLDLLIVRDNAGGLYQGKSRVQQTDQGRLVEHCFSYSEAQVRQLLTVAARAAADRQGKLHVIVKDGGVPGISGLWREVTVAVANELGIEAEVLNIDLAAYELIRNPGRFDVLAAPNLFGDILADIGGLLSGSRGSTFSGNFNGKCEGVYQTNHGCAHDLAGTDKANPAGQILSLAMMLRESFGMGQAAQWVEEAVSQTWRNGWRTEDVAEQDCRVIGTREMSEHIAQEVLCMAQPA